MQNLLWAKGFLTLKYWDQRNFFTDFTGTSTKETDPQNAYGNICNIGTNILFLQFCGLGPRLDFQSGGAKNIVTKEAQPWFAPTGKFSHFNPLNCLKMTLFQTDFDQNWGKIHKKISASTNNKFSRDVSGIRWWQIKSETKQKVLSIRLLPCWFWDAWLWFALELTIDWFPADNSSITKAGPSSMVDSDWLIRLSVDFFFLFSWRT